MHKVALYRDGHLDVFSVFWLASVGIFTKRKNQIEFSMDKPGQME